MISFRRVSGWMDILAKCSLISKMLSDDYFMLLGGVCRGGGYILSDPAYCEESKIAIFNPYMGKEI